jgi:hypothetical protein
MFVICRLVRILYEGRNANNLSRLLFLMMCIVAILTFVFIRLKALKRFVCISELQHFTVYRILSLNSVVSIRKLGKTFHIMHL